MPDLIAHKGYRERRQYYREGDSDLKHRYEEAASNILDKMGNLLAQRLPQAEIANQLEALTQEYSAFLPIVPLFKQLHVSIKRQLHNFALLSARNRDAPTIRLAPQPPRDYPCRSRTADCQRRRNSTSHPKRDPLRVVQTRLDGAREAHQQQIETLLAIIGTAFAVPQILDRELTSALLSLIGITTTPQEDIILLGFVQTLITIAFALLVRWWIERRRGE